MKKLKGVRSYRSQTQPTKLSQKMSETEFLALLLARENTGRDRRTVGREQREELRKYE